jgi:hypothetical protein
MMTRRIRAGWEGLDQLTSTPTATLAEAQKPETR